MEKFIGPDLIAKLINRRKDCGKNRRIVAKENGVNDRQNSQIVNAECSKCTANSSNPAGKDDFEWFSAEIFSGYFLRHFPFVSERWTNSAINFDSVLVGYEFDEMGMKFIFNRFK